jgi:hypothetical protein
MSRPHGRPSLKFEYAKTLVSTTRCRLFSVSIWVSANDNMTGELFKACLSSPNDCSSAVQNFMSYTNTFSTKRLMAGTTIVSIVDTPAKDNTKSKMSLYRGFFYVGTKDNQFTCKHVQLDETFQGIDAFGHSAR